MADPNLEQANAAAAAVDPNSPQQKAFIDQATYTPGQSWADRAAGKGAEPTDLDKKFFAGLEKSNKTKLGLETGETPEAEEGDEPAAPATPAAPRKLTDPPVAPKQRSNFRKLEAERDALRTQLQELKNGKPASNGAAPAPAAAPAPSDAFLTLQKELDEARTELALLDITKSPEFNAKFEQPRNVTIKQAKNIAGAKGAEIETILTMPPGGLRDAKLEELMKELPPSTAAIVNAANNKLAELEFYKQVEIENNRTLAASQKGQREAQAQRAAALRNAEFDSLLNEWSGAVDALNPTKSNTAPATIQQARNFYEGKNLTPKEQAAMALQSALVPGLLAEQQELTNEVERLQKQLARFTGGLPGGGNSQDDGDEPAKPNTPQQRDQDMANGLQRAIRSDPTFAAVRRHRGY